MRTLLFCLPYAGGGASLYRGWPPTALPGVTVEPVQLPGREERYGELLPSDFDEVVRAVVTQIDSARAPEDQIALLGHSYGAVLAFEVARRLTARGEVTLRHLFASGSVAPGTPLHRPSADLDDDEFVAHVEELAGYRHPALADPDLREVLLPVLRADVAMHESYRASVPPLLSVPVTAVRGRDDHLVSAADCAGWQTVTNAGCKVAELPGGHMYLADDPVALHQLLVRTLTVAPARERSRHAR
ncbi:thioesterase II family protein [Salinispora arenicola]|uniref:thioesterase II family protein n=1 Tax=Salinispora arenicola TaxID=168697 RepID=UPI000369F116|nr:alpha/beta fold hydrolase [Salinispora arenicola]